MYIYSIYNLVFVYIYIKYTYTKYTHTCYCNFFTVMNSIVNI